MLLLFSRWLLLAIGDFFCKVHTYLYHFSASCLISNIACLHLFVTMLSARHCRVHGVSRDPRRFASHGPSGRRANCNRPIIVATCAAQCRARAASGLSGGVALLGRSIAPSIRSISARQRIVADAATRSTVVCMGESLFGGLSLTL